MLLLCAFTFAQRITNANVSLVNSQGQTGTTSQVLVRFSLTAGQSCPGYELLHCTDSINYLQFYNYAGICGDQTKEVSFSHAHSNPTPEMVNYYKISIPGYEISPPMRIFVGSQAPQSNLKVYPNPAFNESYLKLIFSNYFGKEVYGFLYDQKGIKMKTLTIAIQQDRAEVYIGDLEDGMYIVWLTDGNILFRSKFIVKRV